MTKSKLYKFYGGWTVVRQSDHEALEAKVEELEQDKRELVIENEKLHEILVSIEKLHDRHNAVGVKE